MLRVKKVFILCMALFFAAPFLAEEANAAAKTSSINITTEAGLDGKVMDGEAFLLKVTLENTGQDFKGDLLIPFSPSYEMGGNTLLTVDIPANSKKTYTVTIPGISSESDYSKNKMKLYEGNWQDGQIVSFTGKKEVKINLITDYTLGILSDQYDQFKELRSMSKHSIYTTEMTKEDLPDNALALETLSFLLVDQFALADLSDSQQEAIKQWVQNGGVLLTSATTNGSQAYGNLETFMPLLIGQKESLPLTALNKENKDSISLDSYRAKLNNQSEVIALHNNTPIVAETSIGEGKVIQTSFSLSDNKLVDWQGYSDWIGSILLGSTTEQVANSQYGSNTLNNLYYSFAESNEYFSNTALSITTLLLILAIYLIIIVPILYVALKKMDKREHAWWIIPVISILLSVGMFITGAKDRIGKAQFNEMGIYQYQNQFLTGYQATTLLSNKSGDFTLAYDKEKYSPIPYQGYGSLTSNAVVKEHLKNNEITFADVEYWSSRTMYGKSTIAVEGGFTHDFTTTDNEISGNLTNNYPYNFQKVFIWSGSEKLDLGPIDAGETKQIDITRKNKYFTKPNDNSQGYYAYDYKGKDLDEFRELVVEGNITSYELWNGASSGNPLIIGITNDEMVQVNLVDAKTKKNVTNLIMQPITLKNNFPGTFTLHEDDLDQDIEIINGSIYSKNFNYDEILLEDGEYIYKLRVPDSYLSDKLSINSLAIQPITNLGLKFSVYNNKDHQYEDVTTLFTVDKEKASAYLDGQNQISIKVEKTTNGDPYTQLPTVKVKGEIKE